jgi:YbbR domain-containing protein
MLRWIGTNLRTFLLAFALALAVWVTAVTAADPDVTQVYPTPIQIEFIGQDPGQIVIGIIPQQVNVTLRAPRSVWQSLTSNEGSIRAIVDLTGLGSGTHTVEVQVQIATQPVRIISVTPKTFGLSLEPLITRSLPIEVTLTGNPAIGYQVGSPVLDPTEAVISGPESIVSQVNLVSVTLDLTNVRQSITASIPLKVMNAGGQEITGITIHPDTVQVSLPIVQQGGYRDLAVKVVTINSPASGYRLTNVSALPPIVTVYSANPALIEAMPGYVETAPLNLIDANANIDTQLGLILPPGVTLIGDQSVQVEVGIAPIESSLTISNRPVEVIGLGQGLAMHISPETVDVIFSGPLPILDSLALADVHVQLDLTGLKPGTYQLTPKVVVAKQGLTVESILPGTVEVVITGTGTPTPTP